MVCLAGCQLVFGLGDYETGAGGGADGDGGTNLPGDGGSGAGGMMTVTTGPNCECGLDPIWEPVSLVDQGDASGTPPGACPDESAPVNVFFGNKPGECSSCSCTASGCASPGLECFAGAACQGNVVALNPSASGCNATGTDFDSCRLAAEIASECSATGGMPVGAPFEQFLSFCGAATCELACEAECITTSTEPAGGCPSEFSHHYQLPIGGSVDCEPCDCEASCGAVFSGGYFNCNEKAINTTGCSDVVTDVIFPMNRARFTASPTCTVNHPATYAGTVTLGNLQTVCCREALPGVAEN
jgi:hypothetical protein